MIDGLTLAIIVGLVGVGIAVAQRTWVAFVNAQRENPEIKFDFAYLNNALIASGVIITVVTGVVPVVIDEFVPFPSGIVTIALVIANFSTGYFGTYRILDSMNKNTDTKIEIGELKEALIAEEE